MTVRARLGWLGLILAAAPLAAQQPPHPADLILLNANIYTADAGYPRADALAIKDGRIVFVGDSRGAATLAGPSTRTIDAGGRTVLPGLIDAHGHLLDLGEALTEVDLVGTTSYQEVVARVAARADSAKAGAWVLGNGWDQNDWADGQFPTEGALSKAVPNNPVMLSRVDGHALLANAMAMKLAGVTAETKDPPGGRIVRDGAGQPTGVFVDNAQGLILRAVPAPTDAQLKQWTTAAIARLNSLGLTGVHDPGVVGRRIAVYRSLAAAGQFNLRDYVMVLGTDRQAVTAALAAGPQDGLYGGHLWIRAIKMYMDGALGSRGAALLEPYDDDPGNTGLLVSDPDSIRAMAVRALKAGLQLNVHAIGDRGNRLVLDAFESALKEVPRADHRFRIEHAQILNYQDIPRFAKLGVIPSMQGSHATSDMYWATRRLGYARTRFGGYVWRSLLNTGVIIPNGSDFPVESANPLLSFHSFFTRQDADNLPAGGWFPEERTTRQEALLAMTLWPAEASFMEHDVGSLTAGKYGDFVMLDQDVMTVAPERVLSTRVLLTVLGGKVVYQAPGAGITDSSAAPAHR